ncbi:hypothetical protein Nos7524_5665 (plasmid) [Nostoc sp. PCC 7524]|nr:hypothetical protein [Nostoc sp. PCC 7524]AFY51355.1 hypothetical protein Nos7524_5665 [Nostoc sp. PCC 7524]
MNEELSELINADYPLSDPSWDYSQIWTHSQEAAAQLQQHTGDRTYKIFL